MPSSMSRCLQKATAALTPELWPRWSWSMRTAAARPIRRKVP
uniref:Uncharacterized protein n=1 Tax=Arundo donax TaxID=35708 RepID=A0A0A8Z3S0_ARUDO